MPLLTFLRPFRWWGKPTIGIGLFEVRDRSRSFLAIDRTGTPDVLKRNENKQVHDRALNFTVLNRSQILRVNS